MDKAQQFLDEMIPKLRSPNLLASIPGNEIWDLLGPEDLRGEVYSEVTKKFHPVRVRGSCGVPEVALTVACQDLDCSQNRFVGTESVHIAFATDEVYLVVRASLLTNKMKIHGPEADARARRIQAAMEHYELVERPKRERLVQAWKERAERARPLPRPTRKPSGQLSLRLGK